MIVSPKFHNNPALANLWRHLRATFAITAVTPLYATNLILGSEYVTFAANKLYLGIEVTFGSIMGVTALGPGAFYFQNNLDVTHLVLKNSSAMWDATAAAANYSTNILTADNIWFSRIVDSNGGHYIKFNGYRITYTP